MGQVICLDLSLLGHWATMCLHQELSVVTSGAPCPRPQVGTQRKKASGHSEVGAGRQGPGWDPPRRWAGLLCWARALGLLGRGLGQAEATPRGRWGPCAACG